MATIADTYVSLVRSCGREEARVYGLFYPAAMDAAKDIAGEDLDWMLVADMLAALSPMKKWTENVRLGWHAASLWIYFGVDGIMRLPVMHSRKLAAISALSGHGPGGGLKVNSFAKNIRGDYDVVTIDRHMIRAAGFDRDTINATEYVMLENQVRDAAGQLGISPAECQAIVWGKWRTMKGLEVY